MSNTEWLAKNSINLFFVKQLLLKMFITDGDYKGEIQNFKVHINQSDNPVVNIPEDYSSINITPEDDNSYLKWV